MPTKSTIRRLILDAEQKFSHASLYYGHGTERPLDEAAWLVLGALGLPLDTDGAALDRPVADAERARIGRLVERRIEERRPVAYLINEAWFAGLPYYVDERVLIPRSPIAELVEERFQPWIDPARVRRILDLGTGSGCIAIACAVAFPDAMVDAVDTSTDALAVARQNAARHGVTGRVQCIESDLFAALGRRRYDLIVANPPYVTSAECAALPPEYRHEPISGLEAGPEGLDVARRLLHDAAAHLEPGGVLVCEVGAAAGALERAFPELPFTWIEFARGGEGVFVLERGQLPGAA